MEPFGTYNGQPVELIRLRNEYLSAEVLTYGATLRALWVPDRDGRPVDVVLGFDTLEDYVNQTCYIGATVGPNANRIAGAACRIGGRTLRLTANDGANNNHSGDAGLDRVVWEVLAADGEAVTLLATHPDGKGGLPGDLRVAVTYWIEARELFVEYRAVGDRATLCNLINHSYFNLDGHDSGDILGHSLCLRAGRFTPTDARSIPTGELQPVAGTPMDFTRPTPLGARIDADDEQLRQAGGYDHNWVLDGGEDGELRPAAELRGPARGIEMKVFTDRPGLQLYTGNYLPEGLRGKDGAVYGRRRGLCLETQGFPDAPNHPNFPSTILPAGKEWVSRTVYRFE